MRVTKEQLVKGIAHYIKNEVIPQINDDKAMQIIANVAVNSIESNTKLVDSIFENNTVKALLKCNEDGTYEIDSLFSTISESVKEYGPFPVTIPPIPFISPAEKTLSFTDSDITEMRKRIERSTNDG